MTNEGTEPREDILFYEEQRPSPVLTAFAYLVGIAAAAFLLWPLAEHLIHGRPGGEEAWVDWMRAIFAAFAIAWLYVAAVKRLIIEVNRDGVFVTYRPWCSKPDRIDLRDVVGVAPESYLPIFGVSGWGLRRCNPYSNYYTISGNRGVRFGYKTFSHRAALLIGTQRPEELASAIRELLPSQEKPSTSA